MIINLVWPRTEIYDLGGESPRLWSALITIGLSLAVGGGYLFS
jgi:hypothetical protein